MARPLPAVLVMPPDARLVNLAGAMRPLWDPMVPLGKQGLPELFADWLREFGRAPGILLVNEIAEDQADEIRRHLRVMTRAGVRLTWFCRPYARMVREVTAGLTAIEVHASFDWEGDVARAFAGKLLFTPSRQAWWQDHGLQDYLAYKTAMSLMRLLAPEPLVEAADAVAAAAGRRFDCRRDAPDDAAALRTWQWADSPLIYGWSEPMRALKDRLFKVGPTPLNVLLLGETGTGKEAAALFLHEFSRRRRGPFVAINCAGLDEQLLRSELFGHRKGAFTGAVADKAGLVERANGGTLFLDEIADLSLPIQADLLRFLQNGEYRPLGATEPRNADLRLVAAAQPRLLEMLDRGAFRRDLYFRIAEVEITTPRLAEMPDDLFRLARLFFYRLADTAHRRDPWLHLAYFKNGLPTLRAWHWPGNVRELMSLCRRRYLLGDDVLAELAAKIAARDARQPPTAAATRLTAPHSPPADPRSDEAIAAAEHVASAPGRDAAPSAPDRGDGMPAPASCHPTPRPPDDELFRPLDEVIARHVRRAVEHRGDLSLKALARRLGRSFNTLQKLLGGRDTRPAS